MSEVVRQAHIALGGVREALQEVDVFHDLSNEAEEN